MKISLLRIEQNDYATFGIILINNQVTNFKTLELPWEENQKNISCISTGRYKLINVLSPKFSYCYEFVNVHKRTDILIHNGNLPEHTQGCVLIGNKFGEIKGKRAVLNSTNSLAEFNSILNAVGFNEDIIIEVRACQHCI